MRTPRSWTVRRTADGCRHTPVFHRASPPRPIIERSGHVGGRSVRAQPQDLEALADLLGQAGRVEPQDAPRPDDRARPEEAMAGHPEDPDGRPREAGVDRAVPLDGLEDPAPEPAGLDALLERHDEALAAGGVEDEVAVERLG